MIIVIDLHSNVGDFVVGNHLQQVNLNHIHNYPSPSVGNSTKTKLVSSLEMRSFGENRRFYAHKDLQVFKPSLSVEWQGGIVGIPAYP